MVALHLHPAGSLQDLLLALAPSPPVGTAAAVLDATTVGPGDSCDGGVGRPSYDDVAAPPVAAAGRPTLLQKLLRKKDYERVSVGAGGCDLVSGIHATIRLLMRHLLQNFVHCKLTMHKLSLRRRNFCVSPSIFLCAATVHA